MRRAWLAAERTIGRHGQFARVRAAWACLVAGLQMKHWSWPVVLGPMSIQDCLQRDALVVARARTCCAAAVAVVGSLASYTPLPVSSYQCLLDL